MRPGRPAKRGPPGPKVGAVSLHLPPPRPPKPPKSSSLISLSLLCTSFPALPSPAPGGEGISDSRGCRNLARPFGVRCPAGSGATVGEPSPLFLFLPPPPKGLDLSWSSASALRPPPPRVVMTAKAPASWAKGFDLSAQWMIRTADLSAEAPSPPWKRAPQVGQNLYPAPLVVPQFLQYSASSGLSCWSKVFCSGSSGGGAAGSSWSEQQAMQTSPAQTTQARMPVIRPRIPQGSPPSWTYPPMA
mmetsp:Transcript_93353/g.264277  ORF Transcript_93353/g.264277 Transcript_93353/m.264277 type:complete len:245 (+) Transcript_93353:185-919(+)